jgi:hypothetical protein
VIAATVLSAVGLSAAPRGGGDYALSPQQSQVSVGALCTLSVVVDVPDDSVGCVECRISFDAGLLTLVDAGEGALFTESGIQGLFFSTVVAPDTHVVEGCLLGYRTHAVTPGELARFVFQGTRPGVAAVRIQRLNLWDIDRVQYTPPVDPYAWITVGTPTGARMPPAPGLALSAWPNPFNPATTLEVSGLEVGRPVDVVLYGPDGRQRRQLARGAPATGNAMRIRWDGRDDAGRRVPSGVYFALAASGGERRFCKLVLLQ